MTIESPSKTFTKSEIGGYQAMAILACAWAFYWYEYVLRASPTVISNELMRDYGITSSGLGFLVGLYYLAYVPLQLPCGIIVDRFGARKVISISSLFCVVGSLLFAKSETLFGAQAGRLLLGAGSACAYLSCTKVAAEWFHAGHFALIAGITQMMGTLGGTFGAKPFALLSNAIGWRDAMFIAAIAGAFVALCAWLVIRDRPENRSPHQPKKRREHNLLTGLKVTASNPQNWLIGLYGCMMYLPLSAFAELWGTPYLMQRYGIDNAKASIAGIMVLIGMGIGSVVSPIISNKIKSRKKIMAWAVIGTILAFSFVFYGPVLPYNTLLLVLFLGGVINGGQILYFASAKEISLPEYSGTTIGFTNGFVMASGLIFQPLLGYILDWSWDKQYGANNLPLYTTVDYQIAFGAVIIALLLGLVLLRFIEETYDYNKKI